jgi:transposase
MFGTSSEKVTREIEQLGVTSRRAGSPQGKRAEATPRSEPPGKRPSRQSLPEHLPREVHVHMPEADACTACGGELRKYGEDVSEMLEMCLQASRSSVMFGPKLCCTKCDVILEAPAPSRPIDRGLAGPGLLAHALVSKYADHLPLYRQSEIYAREGVDLERSTLADWGIGSDYPVIYWFTGATCRSTKATCRFGLEAAPARHRKAQRTGSGSLSTVCAGEDRRSPGQRPTRTPALARCRSSTRATRKSLSVHQEKLRGHLNLT